VLDRGPPLPSARLSSPSLPSVAPQLAASGMARASGRLQAGSERHAPLERHGWAILHDVAIPGSPANIDHLAIGPGGVLVIDSKQYRGAAAARRLRDALARPPPARLGPTQGPVGGRPGRRGPWHRRPPDPGHRGRAWHRRPLGPGSQRRRDGRSGRAGAYCGDGEVVRRRGSRSSWDGPATAPPLAGPSLRWPLCRSVIPWEGRCSFLLR
jgi:hypothetical protein